MPLCWSAEDRDLLPDSAKALLKHQEDKYEKDWSVVQSKIPEHLWDWYKYYWLIVNTRCFYWVYFKKAKDASRRGKKLPRDECLALVPWGDYEIAHINFSTKTDAQVQHELAELESKKRAHADDEGIGGCPHEDDKPIVGWHKDSYPFVCVLMLSDCTNMIGGETAMRTGTGGVMKVRGPQMVCPTRYALFTDGTKF